MVSILLILCGFIGIGLIVVKIGMLPIKFIWWVAPVVVPMMILMPKSWEQPTEKIAEYMLLAIGFTIKFIIWEIPKFLLGL